ncbi:Eukaryotic translation initiation factor 5 (fragment) [Mesorhizobium plurifarium]|uniref:Eukaryotic translation initiation factor 5 n=1 Tax=Mesorhizobium plurifarium TaxID=69974 RepID=A0A090GNL7_MESPL
MTLSRELFEADLTFHCPECETPVVRKGSWIKSAKVFICDACSTHTRLTYGLKLAIFDAHLHAPPNLPATRGQSRQ